MEYTNTTLYLNNFEDGNRSSFYKFYVLSRIT